MPPRNFCDIDSKYYLFGKSDTPEEKVRQWMIFELLAVYNVPVQAISIESPVKVGTRQYRADILLLKDYRPWAVIECKRQEDNDISSGIQQAMSYASCLQAEFAVFTNGKDWIVKRCYHGKWISVPDLPIYSSKQYSSVQLDQLLKACSSIVLLIHWIHTPSWSNDIDRRELLLDSLGRFSLIILKPYQNARIYFLFEIFRKIVDFLGEFEFKQSFNSAYFSGLSQSHCNYNLFFEIFNSLIIYFREIDRDFFLEKNFLLEIPQFNEFPFLSMDDLIDFYKCSPNHLGEAFYLFFSYTDHINKNCRNLSDTESLVIQVIHHLNNHFIDELASGSKISISTSNTSLTSSLIELIRFVFENELLMKCPDLLMFEEVSSFCFDSKQLVYLVSKHTL